jgi:hypothetical protein
MHHILRQARKLLACGFAVADSQITARPVGVWTNAMQFELMVLTIGLPNVVSLCSTDERLRRAAHDLRLHA